MLFRSSHHLDVARLVERHDNPNDDGVRGKGRLAVADEESFHRQLDLAVLFRHGDELRASCDPDRVEVGDGTSGGDVAADRSDVPNLRK